jgi:hypothetical protein
MGLFKYPAVVENRDSIMDQWRLREKNISQQTHLEVNLGQILARRTQVT